MKHRVCILTTDSSWGGTEKMIYTLIQGLPKDLFSISLVTLMGDGTLTQKVNSLCERAVNLQARSSMDFRAILKLKKFLREGHFDILHTFLFHANILGRLLGKSVKIPVVISSQQSIDGWRRKRHVLMDRWTSGFSDAIISVCHAAKKRLISVEKVKPEKIYVVYNGLDISEVPQRKNKDPEKEKFGISDSLVIGMVGNFRGMKGHEIFIQAAQLLLKIRDDFHFLVVGDGKERKKYELEVHSNGLKNHFHFLGRIPNIYDALSLMDIFVLPSKWEGLPISILEAMAFKVPVIATAVGGVPEVVRSDQTGVLIPSNDPIALKDAVLKLLENPSFAQRIIEKAHQDVLDNFVQERMVSETVVIYEKFLTEKQRLTS